MGGDKFYPRVLVVNHDPFNSERNNGMTMSNLFRGWPKDKLAQVYLSGIVPGFDTCENYWRLSERDVVRRFFGRQIRPVVKKSLFENKFEGGVELLPEGFLIKTLRKVDKRYTEPLREIFWRMPNTISPELIKWVEDFRPDVIYSMLGTSYLMRLAVKISERFDIPLVPHFTDDWITTQYGNCVGGDYIRSNMMYWLGRVLEKNPVRLVICDAMAKEYQKRYGGRFSSFVNCVDKDSFDPSCSSSTGGGVRFVYIGGLHLNRWASLKNIGRVLQDICDSEGLRSELHVYTYPADVDRYRGELEVCPVVSVKGWVQNKDVPQVLHDSDVLLHVESFDPEIRKYTKFSVSTKIPECMMAGRPILAYGPLEAASIAYVKESGAGIGIGEESQSDLYRSLKDLIVDKDLRLRLGNCARRVALERHDASTQNELFRSVLCESIL